MPEDNGRPQGSPLRVWVEEWATASLYYCMIATGNHCNWKFAARSTTPLRVKKWGYSMDMPKRKNIRLSNYDYSQVGGYFITICTQDKKQILSCVEKGTECFRANVALTELGQIAQKVMEELPAQYGYCLDAYVIMPNHIHMLLMKEAKESDKTVGQLIGAYKSLVANRWYKVCDIKGIAAGKIWQRNYYDHILRNEADYLEKRKYIEENPAKWNLDELYIM